MSRLTELKLKELPQLGEEAGENPLRHSPDDGILQLIGLNLPALACNLQLNRVVDVGAKQVIDWHPARLSHLSVEPQGRTLWQQKYERAYSYGWEDRGPGYDVGQTAGKILSSELETHLFGGFPHSGGGKIGIAWFLPPARQGHVAGPRISRTFSPADEQDGIGLRGEDDGNSGPDQ